MREFLLVEPRAVKIRRRIRTKERRAFLTDPVARQGRTLILSLMNPGIGLRQLPRLISRVEGLRHR